MVSTSPSAALPPTPPSEPNNNMDATTALNGIPTTPGTEHRHIWVITGPAGCGKTSVAEFLHETYSLPYLEGDTFHTPENVQKMADGQPLTDADRWDWLISLREAAISTLEKDPSSSGVIVTCSALKRKYRDVIRIASYHDTRVRVHFVFLSASESLLMDRVRARKNHYMKDYMVHSQFESLETPQEDEIDVLSVDASGNSREVQELSLVAVKKALERDAGKV